MPSDYEEIRLENERRYGTDIGRIGRMLLAERYDERTHFVFELLQNAEDALGRRVNWSGSRAVSFELSSGSLRVGHFGAPFSGRDVRGICGIAESGKGLTEIGRFGIGFKSVYAVTDRPEIHSGDEHFGIDSFVWPTGMRPIKRKPGETVFVLPLREDEGLGGEIATGLQRLGPRMLLFLHQIERISWVVRGGKSGLYIRSQTRPAIKNARQVMLIGRGVGTQVIKERWLVFSREIKTSKNIAAGHAEIAFRTEDSGKKNSFRIQPVKDVPLFVFFPTILPTHVGFVVQGPYRTTPSRDNVPRNDAWNQRVAKETAGLLVDSLQCLRDGGLLDVNALSSLPLERSSFGDGSMFAPLFDEVRKALSAESLLPRFGGGYVSARGARLARTQELRDLISPAQLTGIVGERREVSWVSEEITQDRTPELRRYLIQELEIAEITPEAVLPKLTKRFLEAQDDKWILALYRFLKGQPALFHRLTDIPLVRLEDGKHVAAKAGDQLQAFLPGPIASGFPTVRRSVCAAAEAIEFLRSLGLSEPDPVDDVVRNVLPKYSGSKVRVIEKEYAQDISRMIEAFETDSKAQREKLLSAAREANFVRAIDAGDGSKWVSRPADVYIATQRLKDLFENVSDVLLVDDSYACLRGEAVRDLLEACGATRYLQPVAATTEFSWQERREMRVRGGCADSTYEYPIEDFTLRGLDKLLETLPKIGLEEQAKKASLLWEELRNLEDRRGSGAFSGTYRWQYYYTRNYAFDAAFTRQLNTIPWVPRKDGRLEAPSAVVFAETGWDENLFLLSKIRFRPPILETLAREAGIEPGILDLLKRLGVTSEFELRGLLGLKEDAQATDDGMPDRVEDPPGNVLEDAPAPRSPAPDEGAADPSAAEASGGGHPGSGPPDGERTDLGGGGNGAEHAESSRTGARKRTPGMAGGRPFISYIGVHPDDDEIGSDPDGLDQETRMNLEAQAIELILSCEPEWQRTPTHNPGYDLFQAAEDGTPTYWCEVKAMSGSLKDRPVGLSHTQFDCAREHGAAYWLYIVEHAGTGEARIVEIQDPAGKARTFMFDHGWLAVADLNLPQPSGKSGTEQK
jgi:hypothetical protein